MGAPRGTLPSCAVTGPLSGQLPPDFELPNGRAVILFDGVCNFCNRWVSFVLDNDKKGRFSFASLQSPRGRQLLEMCGRSPDDLSTFVVIDEDGFHTQSTAALRVGQTLGVPVLTTLSRGGFAVPPALRDPIYRLVAENRYSILGKDTEGAEPSCKL